MPGPNNPPEAGFPIPPPVIQLPWGAVSAGGEVWLNQNSFDFLTRLWAAIQGAGGIVEIVGAEGPSLGITLAAIEEALANDARAAQLNRPLPGPRFTVQQDGGTISNEVELLNFVGAVVTALNPGALTIDIAAAPQTVYMPLALGSGQVVIAPDGRLIPQVWGTL